MKLNTLFIIWATLIMMLFVGSWVYLYAQDSTKFVITDNVDYYFGKEPCPEFLLNIGSSDSVGKIESNMQLLRYDEKGNVGIGDPTSEMKPLHIVGNEYIGKPSKNVTIPIERFNELLNNSELELIDYYVRNGVWCYLWKNKQTGEEKEGLSSYPAMRKLNINGFEKTE